MKRRMIALLLAALSTLAFATGSAATPDTHPTDALSIPQRMNYQGRLTDSAGAPINGTRSITFALYDVAVGGTPVWTETQTVTVNEGLFNVILGSVTPITPAAIPDGPDCYFAVTIDGGPIAPRIPLASAPYAYDAQQADNADKIDNQHASAFAPATHTHSATGDVTGSVTGTLTIAAGAVTMDKINQAGATTGQVVTWGGSAWSPQDVAAGGRVVRVIHGVAYIAQYQMTGTASFSPSIDPAKSVVMLDGVTFKDGNYAIWQGDYCAGLTSSTITVGVFTGPWSPAPLPVGYQIIEYE